MKVYAVCRRFCVLQIIPAKGISTESICWSKAYANFAKSGKEEPAVWLGDHHDNGTAYTYASYIKGETFLVELGYIVGEENLNKIMLKYYDEWAMKHPTERDFIHIAQLVSGMDLKWFQHYWINTTKTIDYGIKNVKYDPQSTTITLVNKGGVPMPIDFSILTKDKKVINYNIPLNLTRVWKTKDIYGNIQTLPFGLGLSRNIVLRFLTPKHNCLQWESISVKDWRM
jgi:hypothetical protein